MTEEGKIILEAIGEMKQELKQDIAELREDVAVLKEDVAVLKTDVAELKEDVAMQKEDIINLKDDNITLRGAVNRLQLKMEHELERSINLIMENHLDLSRKLDEAIEVKNEFKLGLIRIEILEKDVRGIKDFVAYPA